MNKQTAITLLKLTAALSLFTGIIGFIFLVFLPSEQSNNKTEPTPTISVSPTVTIEPTNTQ